MGMKFNVKGVSGALSIALPVITWAIDRFWKKEKEQFIYDLRAHGDRRSQKNVSTK